MLYLKQSRQCSYETTAARAVDAGGTLLESVLTDTRYEEADWITPGLESFQQDWDNVADTLYDEWREHCKRDAQPGVLPDAAAQHDMYVYRKAV